MGSFSTALGLGWLRVTENDLEARLVENESVVDKIQAIVLWRNIIGVFFTVVLVNFLFWVVLKFDLGVIPTLVFVWIVQISLSLAREVVPGLFARVYPDVTAEEKANAGSNAFRSMEQIAQAARPIVKAWVVFKDALFGQPDVSVPFIGSTVAALIVLLILSLVGTLRVVWVLTDLVLIVPGFLLHPAINGHVVKVADSLLKQPGDRPKVD